MFSDMRMLQLNAISIALPEIKLWPMPRNRNCMYHSDPPNSEKSRLRTSTELPTVRNSFSDLFLLNR